MADETYTKADVDAAIKDAVEAAVGPLKAKNTELLDEVKSLKKGRAVDPAEVEKLENRIDELTGKLTTAEKAARDAVKAAEKADAALKAEAGFTHRLLVENGLREQLVANGVTSPVHQKYAMAELAKLVQISADGDTRVAKVGDKALADFVKEWAGSEEGKHFVAAPANNGGGAPGGRPGTGNGKQVTRSEFDGMDPASRKTFMSEGGKVVDAAA